MLINVKYESVEIILSTVRWREIERERERERERGERDREKILERAAKNNFERFASLAKKANFDCACTFVQKKRVGGGQGINGGEGGNRGERGGEEEKKSWVVVIGGESCIFKAREDMQQQDGQAQYIPDEFRSHD